MFLDGSEMNYVPKRWGYEIWICNNDKYCGKKLFIRQGKFCSYHFHKIKDEVLFVDSGQILMGIGTKMKCKEVLTINAGSAYHVKPGVVHQMFAVVDTMILEFSTKHSDEDSYQITKDLVNESFEVKDGSSS